MLAERLALPFARMLVVAFSVTATTTGIAILGFHATVITLRVLASLVMNHADFLAMDAFAALTAVVAFVAVPAVLAIVLVTAFGTGFGLALLLGRRALLFRILLFAGLPIGLATLIGTLVGAPLAIVGSTLFAGFGTLLLMQPRVLLLDEPLGALDLKLRKEMQQELKYIQQEVGITFIFVTHDQEEALTMSDKIVVMNAGEIQQIGTPTEIYRTPVNEFVAKFIGETNIIDGVMLEDDLVMFEDKKYACRARGYNKNEKVDVVIRPEHLDIVPRAEGMLKGTVKSQLFKGMHYETVVETRVGTSITVKMQVSQDRPVYNEEKGEKISANAFLLDVEDVEELDDAKVVALASAEAWDAETEEPISIKTVEYDIKPETGNYTVTFATANDTSITVKVLVVAQNRVESKVYQEEIYAMNFFKKVEDIQESIALDTDLETWASASAWSLEDGEQVEITDVKYDFDPETITPGVYDVTFSTEGYEYKVSTTHAFEEGEQVGLVFRPEDIHVMKKEGQW